LLLLTIVLGFGSFFEHAAFGLDVGSPSVVLPFGFFERCLGRGGCLSSSLAFPRPCRLFLSALDFAMPQLLLEGQRCLR
jgi:hypothetical protein